jgi:hypothetical protein
MLMTRPYLVGESAKTTRVEGTTNRIGPKNGTISKSRLTWCEGKIVLRTEGRQTYTGQDGDQCHTHGLTEETRSPM